jgi:hypothetical protein
MVFTPLLLLLVWARAFAMALLRSLFGARCWMSAVSDVSWLRISADEFGELFAGLVGSKGMFESAGGAFTIVDDG